MISWDFWNWNIWLKFLQENVELDFSVKRHIRSFSFFFFSTAKTLSTGLRVIHTDAVLILNTSHGSKTAVCTMLAWTHRLESSLWTPEVPDLRPVAMCVALTDSLMLLGSAWPGINEHQELEVWQQTEWERQAVLLSRSVVRLLRDTTCPPAIQE